MAIPQFFPIPPEIFTRACDAVSAHVSQLPFLRREVTVSGEMIGVAMECLNAMPTKTLSLVTRWGYGGMADGGLDRCMEERMHIPCRAVAPIVADVLCGAGIAEPAAITDRRAHCEHRGVRLVPPWTWHLASVTAPSLLIGDDPSSSWLDICPVCRTGFLTRVTGKDLFGIPRTDYYLECSSCSAKFIPVGTGFRLVSIGTIRDPLWKRHLNRTFTPQEWSVLARGPAAGTSGRTDILKSGHSRVPLKPGMLLPGTAGRSLAVAVGERTLYFRPLSLRFWQVKEGTFARIGKTLAELLEIPAYAHLRQRVGAKYSRYLPLRTGIFLSQLKERHDQGYREFLNPYGDEKFCTIRAGDPKGIDRKGILIIVFRQQILHAADCPEGILSMANDVFGRVRPEDCLLGGDSFRCRINTLLCTEREAGLYAYYTDSEDERRSIVEHLTGHLPISNGKYCPEKPDT